MNGNNLCNGLATDSIAEYDGILGIQDRNTTHLLPEKIKAFIGTAPDLAALGIQIPTAEDIGKMLAVNKDKGYLLTAANKPVVVWENPYIENNGSITTAAYVKSINVDNSPYNVFAVCYCARIFGGYLTGPYGCKLVVKNANKVQLDCVDAYADSGEGTTEIFKCAVSANENSFVFSDIARYIYTRAEATRQSNAIVPLRIYAID